MRNLGKQLKNQGNNSWNARASSTGVTGIDGCYQFSVKSAYANVYTITATVTPLVGPDLIDTWTVAVYDPSAGFVTGGGWIYSDAGNYIPDVTLEGKATFGFVSKYKKGASVPSGNTAFVFDAGDLEFHSTSYQWLVIAGGNKALLFKGEGAVNDVGGFGFMLSTTDGGKGGIDTFRIKIWELATETVIYDNVDETNLGGGSIIVHTK